MKGDMQAACSIKMQRAWRWFCGLLWLHAGSLTAMRRANAIEGECDAPCEWQITACAVLA